MMFTARDFIFALLLHLGVVAMLLWAEQWHVLQKPMPDRVVQVHMVSLAELQAMMKKENTKPKATPKEAIKSKPRPKPKPQPSKPKPAKPKVVLNPVPPAKPKTKKVVEEELDYDPFMPMESTPKKRVKKKVGNPQVFNDMLKAQITDVEIQHYITGMQQAVERHWKVPTGMIGKLEPPLVELQLSPSGDVVGVRILESSGSKPFDATLLQAIYAAAPFNIPSQQYDLFKTNLIRFHPLQQ